MYTLSTEKKVAVLSALVEGNSIRSIERMTGIHRDTICRLLVLAGEHSELLLDRKMRGLKPKNIQCDEIWTFVQKKARSRRFEPGEAGDQWIFVAMDADTKVVLNYEVGKRTRETTGNFLLGLQRTLSNERFQITTDGFHFYRAIQGIFGGQADFAQLVKLFGDFGQHSDAARRYSPPKITEVISRVIDGNPDPDHVSTSFVERQNLTMRMQMRRLTRLTNAFSKKLANLKAACALHFAHYNFCRVHSSLRVTPAMAAGISSRVWELGELIA